MPDTVAPPAASLWPQPPQQQGALSGNPMQMLDLIGSLTKNQMLQKELAGRTALGNAYQGALQPDGTLDPERLRSGLSDPAASWMLPEAMSHILTQQHSQFNLRSTQDQAVRDLVGTLPKYPSKEDVYNVAASLARRGVPPPMITGWLHAITHDPKGIAHAVATTQNMAAGPATTMSRVPGPPGPGGEPTTVPLGEANVAGSMPTGLSSAQQISTEQMGKDQLREGNYTADIFPLEQAHDAIKELQAKYGKENFGPGTEGRQKALSAIRAFPGGSSVLKTVLGPDYEEKLKDYAKTDKYLTQGMQNRAASFGVHSDQQLGSAIRGSPNVGINDLAVDELTTAQIALRRAEHSQVLEAAKAGGPNYADERSKWAAKNDIRAFAIDRMEPEARDKLISSMKKGSPEWIKFNHSMGQGIRNGTIPPMPGARSGRDVNGKQAWFKDDPSRPGKYMQFIAQNA